jgi:hypothetical protein
MKRLVVIVAALLTFSTVSGVTAIASSASVCQPNGSGCTKAGTYPEDVVINSSLGGVFKVVWTKSVVRPYSSGVPLYWTAYVTYTNFSSSDQTLACPGDWPDASFVSEHMSGGSGDDGTVPAETTTCSQNPGLSVTVSPGGTSTSFATFHNVPWPGSAVAITWGDVGTSPAVYPFGSAPSSPPPGGSGKSTGPGPITGTPWSGYITRLTTNSNGQPTSFDTFVSARWRIPAADCTAGTGRVYAADSIWVGLGGIGYRADEASGNLVQAGTSTYCEFGKLHTQYAFYEIVPTQPTEQQVGGPVKSGDTMQVSVDYDGPSPTGTHYSIAITDLNGKGHLNWSWSHTYRTDFSNVPDSADWIIESGQVIHPVCLPVTGWCTPGVNVPLADFTTAAFIHATYEGLNGANHLLTQAHATQFIATFAGLHLTAVSSILGGKFALVWEHSGL